uniref:Uncharacterized protein n=1 Tax=Pseudomonas phage Touem01 TaxID=3138548 RepID=A0AAU6W359_9VIRU
MSGQKNIQIKQPGPSGFQAVFYSYLEDLERRAHAQNLTLTDMCREADVARATPDRWRKRLPKTIRNVCDLESVVVNAEAASRGDEGASSKDQEQACGAGYSGA